MTTEGVDEKLIELLKEVGPYVSEDDTEWCRENGVRIWRVTDKPMDEFVSKGGKLVSFAWVNGTDLNIDTQVNRDNLVAVGRDIYERQNAAGNVSVVDYGFCYGYGKIGRSVGRSSLAEGFGG